MKTKNCTWFSSKSRPDMEMNQENIVDQKSCATVPLNSIPCPLPDFTEKLKKPIPW